MFLDLIHSAIWLGSLLGVTYTFIGYPFLLWGISLFRKTSTQKLPITPFVSIIIAAWNEEHRLETRIRNCLLQEYPVDCLELIVVSDGSTDGTESVVQRFANQRVRLIAMESRQGKAVAINRGVASARGEIVVFGDARQRFHTSAVAQLVGNFADASVGAVSGELILVADERSATAEGVGLYWRLEKWIRRKESDLGSVVGVTGAIYAIRRSLFLPLPNGTILDDLVVPMRIAMNGYRVLFDAEAKAYDRPSREYQQEFSRKVRTLAGNYQAIMLCPDLMKPWRNPLWIQFISHKICRLMAPFFLVGLLASSVVMASSRLVLYILIAQLICYALALIGWRLSRMGIQQRWLTAAYTFCLLNYAALVGAFRFVSRDGDLWKKTS